MEASSSTARTAAPFSRGRAETRCGRHPVGLRGFRRAQLQRVCSGAVEGGDAQLAPVVDDVAERLKQVLQDQKPGAPFYIDDSLLSEEVSFRSDVWSVQGVAKYHQTATKWMQRQDESMPEWKIEVENVSQLGPGEVVARWRLTWTPSSLGWLVSLAESWPGVERRDRDILDRIGVISQFRWAALRKLLWTAATEGYLTIPIAAMPGSTTFTIQDGKVTRIVERLELVSKFEGGVVKNRRIAKDMMLFMQTRQPLDVNGPTWDDRVEVRLRITSVPGMGQFDIDGMQDAGTRSGFYEDVASILALATVVVLTFGGALGWAYVSGLKQQEAYRKAFEVEERLYYDDM